MRRRDLIATGTFLAAASAAGAATASETPTPGGGMINLVALGLPVISGGRVRNYVFLRIRLYLGAGHTPEALRPKEPFFRDALVRAAHRTPFTIANDWTALNASAISAVLMRTAQTLAGSGAVTRVEILSQTPRRRTLAPRS